MVTLSPPAPGSADQTQVLPADDIKPVKNVFRADIQALRAVAVLTVVLYHAHIPYLTGGYVGVDVFFVISGFLITGLLVREKDRTGRISIKKFYGRRMRRIMPAAALTMIATVVASYHYLGYIRGAHIAEDAQWSSVFLANIHFAAVGTDYLNSQDPPSTLQHFWSLSVEEQFYVVWPVLFLILGLLGRKYRSKWLTIVPVAVVVVASYAFSIWYTSASVTQAYFSPFTRACELGAGALLAREHAGAQADPESVEPDPQHRRDARHSGRRLHLHRRDDVPGLDGGPAGAGDVCRSGRGQRGRGQCDPPSTRSTRSGRFNGSGSGRIRCIWCTGRS